MSFPFRPFLTLVLVTPFLLWGCSDPVGKQPGDGAPAGDGATVQEAQTDSSAPLASQNATHQKLAALPTEGQKAELKRMLAGSSIVCSEVTRVFFQGFTAEGRSHWNVACQGGGDWSISIDSGPAERSSAVECELLQQEGTPCWRKLTP